jgi:superfamily II RNA helicase
MVMNFECILFFLSGTFNDLDHHQIAALASCFIPGDKSSEQIQLRTELARPLQQLQESARKIAEVLFHIAFLHLSCTCMQFCK